MQGIQYSKILPIITGIIFATCLYKAFNVDLSTVLDTTLIVTCVTASGGIFATTVLAYLKKASVENNIKLRIVLYKSISSTQLKYNERMMQLKQEYSMTDDDITNIEATSNIVSKTEETLSSADTIIEDSLSDASTIEQQTV